MGADTHVAPLSAHFVVVPYSKVYQDQFIAPISIELPWAYGSTTVRHASRSEGLMRLAPQTTVTSSSRSSSERRLSTQVKLGNMLDARSSDVLVSRSLAQRPCSMEVWW